MVATHIGPYGRNAVQRVVLASGRDPETAQTRSQWEAGKIVTT